ncbi:MAG: PilZ domain-containing protein [Oscillospiraceae bacterium]|jgi:c-di-GMP-binding flagellar brake protein YcgR|nr:PilZ domain-containing protein [Oscillospiraceae bacterium]
MGYELALGDRLEIMIGEHRCVSDVQEITPRGRLVVSMPMYRSMIVPLQEGEMIQLSYYRTGGMFSFTAQITQRYRDGALDLMELEFNSPISKYQRRDYVRLDTVIPVSVRLIALPERLEVGSPEETLRMLCDRRYVGAPRPLIEGEAVYPCYTVDLSGGGVRFASNEKFNADALVECTLRLEESSEVTVDGQVVRVDEQISRAPAYRVSAKFVGIDERTRRKIIKYIYEQEVRQRQRVADAG